MSAADTTGTTDEPVGKLPVVGGVHRAQPGRDALMTTLDCQRFLYDEAALLDAWALDDWFGLFTEDGLYYVPATDNVYGEREWDLALVDEDVSHLAGRVQRLKSTWAHIENPHSRTKRVISNVRVLAEDGAELDVEAAFVTYRSRPYQTTVYAGTNSYRLRRVDGDFRIVTKVVRLVHETLRDSGGVLSIIL